MTNPVVIHTKRYLVQTAPDLPASDDGWTTRSEIDFLDATQGQGTALGRANFRQSYGRRTMGRRTYSNPGVTQVLYEGPEPDLFGTGTGIGTTGSRTTLCGLLVRVLEEDESGSTEYRGLSWTPIWHGEIIEHSLAPNLGTDFDAGGEATWTAIELPAVLDKILIRRGYVWNGSEVVDPGYFPPFNDLPLGDMRDSDATVNGVSVRVHDLSTTTGGTKWTGTKAMQTLLAGPARGQVQGDTAVRGWTWTLSDPDGCLGFDLERIAPDGHSVLEVIAQIINPARGLTWWHTVSGTTVTIHVRSTVAEAVTVGGYTLPASTATAAVVAGGNAEISGVSVSEDHSSTYDVIEIVGAQPWVAISLSYQATGGTPSLGKGWDSDLESDWADNPEFSAYGEVWRRFEVLNDWNGAQYDETGYGMRNEVATATSAAYGAGGLTGSRTFTATQVFPGLMLRGERLLPVSDGFSVLRVGPRQKPVVVIGTAGAWEDYSDQWEVTVEQNPLAVRIDDGQHGMIIKGLVDAGQTIIVTVGVREAMPLRVSWQRDAAQWPRSLPRIKRVAVDSEQWLALQACVTGITDDGTDLIALGAEVEARNDLAAMQSMLALLRGWYSDATRTVAWTRIGTLDSSDALRPGRLLTSFDDGYADRAINAIISSRSWRRVMRSTVDGGSMPTYDTSYTTMPSALDLEARGR